MEEEAYEEAEEEEEEDEVQVQVDRDTEKTLINSPVVFAMF